MPARFNFFLILGIIHLLGRQAAMEGNARITQIEAKSWEGFFASLPLFTLIHYFRKIHKNEIKTIAGNIHLFSLINR
ncbi:MAG: hypothetical protein K8F52_12280 [Candidatus Scalindua rubra]|nr:hypothetical protein [Candidatus Scalindua rubra]